MKTALGWVMATRWRAVAVVTAFALLPLTGVVASALVVLATLRHGLREGLLVAFIATAAVIAFDVLAGGGTQRGVAMLVINWLPVAGLAAVLARTVSLARTLQIAAVAACGVVVGVWVAAGDPTEAWMSILGERVFPFLMEVGVPLDPDVLEVALPQMAMMMTGLAAAFWAVGHFITVLVGRWWQAMLVNPGGFRREFHGLRMGGFATAVGSVVFLAAVLSGWPLLWNLALVMLNVFAMQGLAVLHGVAGRAGLHWFWLVPPYAFLVILPPHMLGLLAVMGFMDHWIDFRGRINRKVD